VSNDAQSDNTQFLMFSVIFAAILAALWSVHKQKRSREVSDEEDLSYYTLLRE